jgi:hypothetical protein
MANPIIKIKRGTLAPTAGQLQAGEFAIDQVAKNLYLGVEVGGVVTNEIVGGNGTFATHTDVATALGGVSGTLGNMAVQNKETINITGGTLSNGANALFINGAEISSSPIDSSPIGANIASTGAFTSLQVTSGDLLMTGVGNIDMNAGRVVNLSAPVSANDAVRKTDLDSAISALGAVFHYAGNVSDATTPFDLATLPYQTTGSYYRVDVAGTYVDPVHPNASFEAKVGDAFVLSVASGFQKIDNVDVEVLPTANEIAVTGDENTGYTVSIDPVFSGRVSTAETDISDLEGKTQNITAIAGETYVAGILTSQELWVGPNSTDAVKLLNPVAGPASVEAPAGKELVIKNGAGNTAITVIDSGSGRVDFAYDVNVAAILDASVLSAGSASFGSMGVNSSANFNGGINVNTGNLVGNGTNEITDFVIDGGSY